MARPTQCLTSGAQYAIAICHDRVQIVVTGDGFQSPQTETEARLLEDCLHNVVELVLAPYWGNRADADSHTALEDAAAEQGVQPVRDISEFSAGGDRPSGEAFAAFGAARREGGNDD